MALKQMLKEQSEEHYFTWGSGRLFSIYLTCLSVLDQHGKLHPNDLGELEKVTWALNAKPLPEKVGFYKSLGDFSHRTLYRNNFLEVASLTR